MRIPRKIGLLACFLLCALCRAADPVHTAWILSPAGSAEHLPDVHAVESTGQFITVRSNGISLRYLGPLQQAPIQTEAVREFSYRIPLRPEPETARHARAPVGVIGTFLNGLPIYNHFESLSFNGANLWHYDTVAAIDDGTITSTGRARPELTHPAAPGLLEQLIADGRRHSPLIGFALDGYPVYGPWAFANADGAGGLRRMRSSYRLRSITHRQSWPRGIALTPEQYGPDVSAADPLGTFAEDYEYAPGSGDLNEFNGRFARTPEYPAGTYAYFLTTDTAGRLAFPYLIGPRYYGRMPASENFTNIAKSRLELSADQNGITAQRPVRFRLLARDSSGEPIRHFEYVHERPIHFLIVSSDLWYFEHIHPELAADDYFEVTHTFPRVGRYRIWVDYSLPGEPPHVDHFDILVTGIAASVSSTTPTLDVNLTPSTRLVSGVDIPITLTLAGPLDKLEPFLGAWAHVIVISDDLNSFTHAHPIESAVTVHTHTPTGPPPSEIHIVTSFPTPGRYKLWAQFQKSGQVVTVPFVLDVANGPKKTQRTNIPPGAIAIRVTPHGYDPPSLTIPANKPLTLAFTRDSAPNCGSVVVFPSLGIRKSLPLGETVLIELPAQPKGELAFSCGMGMYRGMMIAKP